MAKWLDPAIIRREIENLRITYPDVANDEEAFQLALESETGLHEFLADVLKGMADDNSNVIGLDAWIDDLTVQQHRFKRRIEAMRSLILKLMQAADLPKLQVMQGTLSISAGQPRVIITDESALPEGCIRTKREPDREAIKQSFKIGIPVPGAELSNSEPYLRITGIKFQK